MTRENTKNKKTDGEPTIGRMWTLLDLLNCVSTQRNREMMIPVHVSPCFWRAALCWLLEENKMQPSLVPFSFFLWNVSDNPFKKNTFLHFGPDWWCYISKHWRSAAGSLSRLSHGFCRLNQCEIEDPEDYACSLEQRLWIWSILQ